MATFDDLLEEAGAFGRCQRRVFALLCLVSLPFAGVYVGTVFQGFTPDHWCRDPAVAERRQACGWSLAESRRLTVPLVNGSGVPRLSSCEQYEVDWNATELTCDTQELDLSEVPVTECKVRPLRLISICWIIWFCSSYKVFLCFSGWFVETTSHLLNIYKLGNCSVTTVSMITDY